jgi:hypothetical protein
MEYSFLLAVSFYIGWYPIISNFILATAFHEIFVALFKLSDAVIYIQGVVNIIKEMNLVKRVTESSFDSLHIFFQHRQTQHQ